MIKNDQKMIKRNHEVLIKNAVNHFMHLKFDVLKTSWMNEDAMSYYGSYGEPIAPTIQFCKSLRIKLAYLQR